MENPMEQQLKDDQEADEEAIIEEPNIDPASVSSSEINDTLTLSQRSTRD